MWVERGDASAGGKIVYSSTFDAVVDAGCEEDLNPTESSTALFNVAVSPAVNATVDGRLGCVLCVGSGPDKRQALFDACGEPAISGLLAAAEDKGFSLAVCGLLVFWERLYDLLDDARPIEGPPSASATGGGSSPRPLPGLLGATTRTVSSAADGAALIASLPALATKAEEDIVGAAVAGHLAVQLSLHDSATGEVVGRTLLVDVADATASAAAPSLLASTLCHASATMLQKALAKPSTRPAACDATVLTRILAPVFDHPASTTSRLVLNVTADAPQGTVDVLRTAQAAAGGKIGSKGKDRAAKESADRRSSVTEHLQRVISECADKPPVESDVLAESLKQAMGDVAELQKELAECVNERNVTDVELDKLKASRDAGANGSAETEAERQMAEWAAEEEALAAQLAAERDEAEKLLKLLQEHEGKGGGESGAEELREQVAKFEKAVESAWEDVQRAQKEAEETEARFDRAREVARQSAQDKEEMESTLLDVAADLENLARNYRQHGSPAMAVPLYVSALAIFEKTLGPEHPQVASNLVNLGNAFCDQQKHIDAVPVYLRALAIDEKALGHDHPEVCAAPSSSFFPFCLLSPLFLSSSLVVCWTSHPLLPPVSTRAQRGLSPPATYMLVAR